MLRSNRRDRVCCLLKEIAEGTYKTKHAEGARLVYRTTQRHTDTNMNKYTPASTPKLGHVREIHCAPSHLGQHGVARHEAHPHVGERERERVMSVTMPANACPWPAHREASGFVDLGAHLGDEERRLAARCHVQHGVLTLWSRTGADDNALPQELLRISSPYFKVLVVPGHYNVFVLFGQDGDRTEEVYCYTADQTA